MPDVSSIKRVAVIMAGGTGERFWPLSRENKPKQLLRLTRPDKTMLEEAIDRVAPLIPYGDIYVQTMPHLLEAIRQANLPIPAHNVLAEPCKRNTAGCLSYAAAYLGAKYGDECCMAVLTADHAIGEDAAFLDTVRTAMETAEAHDVLVTLGIAPTRPETGYGYIERGDADSQRLGENVFPVKSFKEKPSLSSAENYLKADRYYWNSGMFFWRIKTFLSELDSANQHFAQLIREMTQDFQAGNTTAAESRFETLESISIDFALMEKAKNVVVIPADFGWDDVGSLLSLERGREKDTSGNVAEGSVVLVECANCTVMNGDQIGKTMVAVVGMQDAVVVVTDDAVLVAAKDKVENVRDVVQRLREGKHPQI